MIKKGTASLLMSGETGIVMLGGVQENMQQNEIPANFREIPFSSEMEVAGLQMQNLTSHVIETSSNSADPKRHCIQSNIVAVLATVLIILSIGLLAYKNNQQQRKPQNLLPAHQSSGSNLLLRDGTKIWLSAGRGLSYSPEFGTEDGQWRWIALFF